MKEQEMLNRIGGANGCDLIGVGAYAADDEHIAAVIIHEDATQISQIVYTDSDNNIITDIASGYIATALGVGTLITFKYPVTSITLTAGNAMVYFI